VQFGQGRGFSRGQSLGVFILNDARRVPLR
jgi:hypothetical protein